MGSRNFQPSACSAHVFVAAGSVLASSVCEMKLPGRTFRVTMTWAASERLLPALPVLFFAVVFVPLAPFFAPLALEVLVAMGITCRRRPAPSIRGRGFEGDPRRTGRIAKRR